MTAVLDDWCGWSAFNWKLLTNHQRQASKGDVFAAKHCVTMTRVHYCTIGISLHNQMPGQSPRQHPHEFPPCLSGGIWSLLLDVAGWLSLVGSFSNHCQMELLNHLIIPSWSPQHRQQNFYLSPSLFLSALIEFDLLPSLGSLQSNKGTCNPDATVHTNTQMARLNNAFIIYPCSHGLDYKQVATNIVYIYYSECQWTQHCISSLSDHNWCTFLWAGESDAGRGVTSPYVIDWKMHEDAF